MGIRLLECVLCAWMVGVSLPSVQAQDNATSQEDVMGLVINQTFSIQGQDFYQRFTELWTQVPSSASTNLVIREQKQGNISHHLGIYHEHKKIYGRNMSPRKRLDQALIAQAVSDVLPRIQKRPELNTGSTMSVGDLYYTGF